MMADLPICVDYDDPVVAELIRSSLSRYIPRLKQTPATDASLQWCSYESISFDDILKNRRNLCNSYIFRKALIRKHFLANTVQCWLSKHRESILTKSVPKTYLLECDYSEYLDEALNERFELREALEVNETRVPDKRQHFILKPSMTDRGQGIRIFSTYEELQEIFEEFDNYEDIEEDDNDGLVASQLRHFVVQEYISRPLLLDTIRPGKKFHVRAYVVAFGAIKVWVWSEMLALFAAETYLSPTVAPDEMTRHLTNTCLQDDSVKDENVLQFWSLPLSNDILRLIFRQICQITGEIFLAAAAGQQMHFQVRLFFLRLIRLSLMFLKYLAWILSSTRTIKCTS